MNRRHFLRNVGAGAAASAVVLAPGRTAVASAPPAAGGSINVFGRMFPSLPPFAQPSPDLEHALMEIGAAGGMLDANDQLGAGPIALILDPALSVVNRDNPTHTAGTTFLGQFIDHDITFDASSPLGTPTKPHRVKNERTPTLDLDSVYGSGPVHSAHLYQPGDSAKLLLENGGLFEDVPRMAGGTAVIADPRNDENMVISGLQCAVISFHNRLVDEVREPHSDAMADYARARELTTWHYQWIVVHEFLPQVVGQAMVDQVLASGRRFYRPQSGPVMPVEFQGAAFRFGHSIVRPSYRANLTGNDDGGAFFGFIFDAAQPASPDPDDLVGGFRARRRFIDWRTFFDFGDGEVRPNKRIDTLISTPLFNLPLSTIADGSQPTVLAQRNLLRHVTWSLPSGQDVAARLGEPVLSGGDFEELVEHQLQDSTPLWYYILREAEFLGDDGQHLGPVGGRIVAEVLLGLLELDHGSYLNQRNWRPTLPQRSGQVTGEFSMVDFLTFAGVDPRPTPPPDA